MNENGSIDPAPQVGGSHSDLEKVEHNLREFQGLLKGQRHTMPAPAWMSQHLEARGLLDGVKSASALNNTKLEELKSLYGGAVGRVSGAEDEDLLTLYNLGILLAEFED